MAREEFEALGREVIADAFRLGDRGGPPSRVVVTTPDGGRRETTYTLSADGEHLYAETRVLLPARVDRVQATIGVGPKGGA